ncbi:RNA-directed DNA polymerase, eukaryota [Tanacetum coccineum]
MKSDRWPLIYAAIQRHLQKIYNGKKAALKERHWIPDSDGTYDLERIRLSRPSHISEVNWDAQIAFWNDPKNRARATQNKQNRAKSKVVCRQGSRSIAALRDMHMESSATREYPSLIHTFFLTHTVNGVFLNPEDKALYEMMRLQGLGSNTEIGVPYTEDEIMAIIRGASSGGHILDVGRVLPGQGTVIPPSPLCTHSSDVVKLKKREKVLTRQMNMFMKLFRSDDKFSQMLTQLESQPEMRTTARTERMRTIVKRCWRKFRKDSNADVCKRKLNIRTKASGATIGVGLGGSNGEGVQVGVGFRAEMGAAVGAFR